VTRLGGIGLALLLLAGCASPSVQLPAAPIPYGPTVAVRAKAVPLDPGQPERTEIDGFRYAGGVALKSAETSRLHGLSDLRIGPGGRITMVSDVGDLWTATLTLDAAGRLTGWTDVSTRALLGEDGQPFPSSDFWDAEGLTFLGADALLVSFEQTHRIWRYDRAGSGTPVALPRPEQAMADNDGMEGLAAAPAIAPDAYWVGVEPGGILLCRVSAACVEHKGLPRPLPGMRLSGLTTGPDGELVILHHVYMPGIGSRVVVTIVRDPAGAATVIGRFAMGRNSSVDNFEGVDVERKANGDWRLYLLTDDNFRDTQRTLMLAFDWTPPK
jgi:hypothetical protein